MLSNSTTPLWTGEEFITALDAHLVGNLPCSFPVSIGGISIDSRTLQPGEAFFAIRGDRFDGHGFAEAAAKAGAALLVVEKTQAEKLRSLNCPLMIVDDVLGALQALARQARVRLNNRAKVIAVTGSVGKTTIKEALRTLLSQVGKTHASPASFNNHWGVPLTLARMPRDTDFAIFEIGMNHAGEIRPLTQMVRPHIAIINAIASAHMAAFASLEEIARAKAEIFDGVETDGYALLNGDDTHFPLLETAAIAAGISRVMRFGVSEVADYRLLTVQLSDRSSLCEVSLRGERHHMKIAMPGRHMVQNMLAVLGAADLAGAHRQQIISLMPELTQAVGRGRHYQLHFANGGSFSLIDESYNANPSSMRAAIAVLGGMNPVGKARRIVIFGDMLELGEGSKQAHEDLLPYLTAAKVDQVFLIGKEMRHLADKMVGVYPCVWRKTAQELQPLILSTLRDGDIVTVKSSNAINSAQIVQTLLQSFA